LAAAGGWQITHVELKRRRTGLRRCVKEWTSTQFNAGPGVPLKGKELQSFLQEVFHEDGPFAGAVQAAVQGEAEDEWCMEHLTPGLEAAIHAAARARGWRACSYGGDSSDTDMEPAAAAGAADGPATRRRTLAARDANERALEGAGAHRDRSRSRPRGASLPSHDDAHVA
jgi:hypothetical protein